MHTFACHIYIYIYIYIHILLMCFYNKIRQRKGSFINRSTLDVAYYVTLHFNKFLITLMISVLVYDETDFKV